MGKPFRVRVRTNKSRSHVRGGASSSINPSVSRYREYAKAEREARRQPLIAIDDRLDHVATVEEGELLQRLPIDNMHIGAQSANHSMVSEGALSRVSQFTNCTNPTFAAVHRQWKSGSSLHADVVAVLAAVAQTIRERNGIETDVEYFVGLLAIVQSAPVEEQQKFAAASYLFQLVIRKVPKEVLIHHFLNTCQVLTDKIVLLESLNDGVAVKFILSSLGILLRAQPNRVWKQSSVRNVIVGIMSFSVHEQPAVRTVSRRVIRGIITDPVTCLESGIHPAAKVAGERILADLKGENSSVVRTRLLCLLEGIMHKIPESVFSLLASEILELSSTADPMVRCAAFQCLYRTLQRQPCDAVLSCDSNVRLIEILCAFPAPMDVAVCAYWLQALTEAHVCLAAKDNIKNFELVGNSLSVTIRVYERADAVLGDTVRSVLARLMQRCVQQNPAAAVKCLTLLDMALMAHNTAVWHLVLRNMSELFMEAQNAVIGPVLENTLKTLCDLRERDTSAGDPNGFCSEEIEHVIGSAIEFVDVQRVIAAVPLNIDVDAPVLATDFKRSWMLLVLKKRIKRAPLALFTRFFLPLAIRIHSRCAALEGLTKKLYCLIEYQIWDLLPSFLHSPTDFELSFHPLAPILGAALNERIDLRIRVLAGLRAVLKFAGAPDTTDERIEVVRRYAKNYLPILFGIYSVLSCDNAHQKKPVADRDVKLSTLETIRMYVPFVPAELVGKYIDSAIERVNDKENPVEKKLLVMDVMIALSKAATSKYAVKMFDVVKPWFKSKKSLQKKAYRVLAELYIRVGDTSLNEFFIHVSPDFENLITNEMELVMPNSWATRLSIFRSIIGSYKNFRECQQFADVICDQVIMCLDRSRSKATRQQAAKCFQELCANLLLLSNDTEVTPSQILSQLVSHSFAFAGVVQRSDKAALEKVRSSLIAMNILCQKHLKIMNGSLISQFLSHSFVFLRDNRPPIRVLAIRLIRVFCQKLFDYTLRQYQDLILDNVFNCQTADENTVNVRRSNRILFEILIEKFGFEVVCRYASKQQGWVKFLKKLEKQRRKKRVASANVEVEKGPGSSSVSEVTSVISHSKTVRADSIFNMLDDSDDDHQEDEDVSYSERKSSVWIQEGDDNEDVIDLLDRKSVLNNITMTNPRLKSEASRPQHKKVSGGFRFAADGRLVIEEEEEQARPAGRIIAAGEDDSDIISEGSNDVMET